MEDLKKYLLRYSQKKRQLELLTEQNKRATKLIGTADNEVVNKVLEYQQQEENKLLKEAYRLLEETINTLDRIQNPATKLAMNYRFVSCLTIKEAARRFGKSERVYCRYLREGLEELQTQLKE